MVSARGGGSRKREVVAIELSLSVVAATTSLVGVTVQEDYRNQASFVHFYDLLDFNNY